MRAAPIAGAFRRVAVNRIPAFEGGKSAGAAFELVLNSQLNSQSMQSKLSSLPGELVAGI